MEEEEETLGGVKGLAFKSLIFPRIIGIRGVFSVSCWDSLMLVTMVTAGTH